MLRLTCLLTVALVVSSLIGCGPPSNAGATVKAKVLKGGQPLKMAPNPDSPPGDELPTVALFSMGAEVAEEHAGDYNGEDGSVIFYGEGDPPGIQPGKYRLVVGLYPGGDPDADQLGGTFGMDNSPIEVEVPASAKGGEHDLGTIELDDHAGDGS